MSYKSRFRPENPKKYRGVPTNIIYRSLWEFKYMRALDRDPNVIEWASEEFSIQYYHPVDKKIHRYFPDFWVRRKKGDKIITEVVEIKPSIQTKPPVKGNKKEKTYINELITYEINKSKWKAADEFCKDKCWQFTILTEKQLNIKF